MTATMAYSDWIITAVIVIVVVVAAMRAGQRNPVGTGKLARRLDALELKVAAQGERFGAMEKSILALADSSRTTAEGITELRLEVAGDRGLTERTWAAVDRLQKYFIEEGIRGRGQ